MDDIFLAYGVRGIAGRTLTADAVKKIAWAFGKLHPGTILLSHDCRNSSAEFYRSAYSGLAATGADVLPAGLATTPMTIFGINHHGADGGLAVTASHNPPEWNGLKFYAKAGEPIGLENGLADIRKIAANAPVIPDRNADAAVPLLEEYEIFLTRAFEPFLEKTNRPLRIAIDNGNGAASGVLDRVLGHFPWIEPLKLFWEPDGSFPGRGPNPLLEGALEPLAQAVRKTKADFGIAFDADGDRIFFADEKGDALLTDWVMAWLVEEFLSRNPREIIVIPVGAPRIVEDVIREHGGEPRYSKIGFVSMRRELKSYNAIFGGERSGHYYFRDFFFADSGIWAMLTMLRFFLERRIPLSQIMAPYRKYFTTGEMNFEVQDRMATLALIKQTYGAKAKSVSELDGFFADMGDWWFSVRPSNTEPLLRVVLESADRRILAQSRQAIIALIEKMRYNKPQWSS